MQHTHMYTHVLSQARRCPLRYVGARPRDRWCSQRSSSSRYLAFTRSCFTSRLHVHESVLFLLHPPPTLRTQLHYLCTTIAQYTTPLRPPLVYVIHHTILVMAILCKGQLGRHPLPRLIVRPLQEIRLVIRECFTSQYYFWHSTPPLLHPSPLYVAFNIAQYTIHPRPPCFAIQHTI